MPLWTNWSGRIACRPDRFERPQNENDIAEALSQPERSDAKVRIAGAGHSHAPLVPTNDLLIDLKALDGVIEIDSQRQWARIRAGTRISALGRPLREAGVALLNQGDIDRQAISGATATGTHGTGRRLQNFSAMVRGMRIVLHDGRVIECDTKRERELFEASRLHLGAFGIVTELTLALRPAYRLQEKLWLESLDTILDHIEALTQATRHFEFFWMPGSTRAACKSLEETEQAAIYPLGPEGERLAWSDEVLANDRPERHTEMEYSVPIQQGPECFRALRRMITESFPNLRWPLEYRTLAADDVWLSSAYDRPCATLSVHQGVDAPDEPLFRACEEIFRDYGGRPHWGKVHFCNAEELASAHPRWNDWWRVRDRWDPTGRFLNDLLATWRP
ncbi:MAG: D-arabinono-1,4-lactone oxidase [Myxococcota bacterium]|nr:D-arabinono-1,4-lactone oxidase [Myxococcota bacterium]